MSLGRMCGVVLWANTDDRKAVVWCEDQGDLAFYTASAEAEPSEVALDAGDLIEFELREEPQFRRVAKPTLLVQRHAPELAAQLGSCTDLPGAALPGAAPALAAAAPERHAANVVPFRRMRDWAPLPLAAKQVTA